MSSSTWSPESDGGFLPSTVVFVGKLWGPTHEVGMLLPTHWLTTPLPLAQRIALWAHRSFCGRTARPRLCMLHRSVAFSAAPESLR